MKDKIDRCDECTGVMGHHAPECSKITLESAKRQLLQYYELFKENYKKYEIQFANENRILRKREGKAFKETEFWKGKFYVVKHENNKLRAKLPKK